MNVTFALTNISWICQPVWAQISFLGEVIFDSVYLGLACKYIWGRDFLFLSNHPRFVTLRISYCWVWDLQRTPSWKMEFLLRSWITYRQYGLKMPGEMLFMIHQSFKKNDRPSYWKMVILPLPPTTSRYQWKMTHNILILADIRHPIFPRRFLGTNTWHSHARRLFVGVYDASGEAEKEKSLNGDLKKWPGWSLNGFPLVGWNFQKKNMFFSKDLWEGRNWKDLEVHKNIISSHSIDPSWQNHRGKVAQRSVNFCLFNCELWHW